MSTPRFRLATAAALALLAVSSCTAKKQETPPLTGPSDVGTSLSMTATPDVLAQDGASQSLVTITARDGNGQPIRNLPLRAEIAVLGTVADFGTLSARNLVTDTSGRATLTYTAPPSPPGQFDAITVGIRVTANGADFGNDTPRQVLIRLVPPGVVTPGPNGVTPRFTVSPPAPSDHQAALFDATTSTSANGTIVSYQWTFGDGGTGSGMTIQHSYSSPGTYVVGLTITDKIGASNNVSQSVNVGQGQLPTAAFVMSPPSNPNIGQVISFNAAGSTAQPGHTISSYLWDFGDGSGAGGQTPTHAYGVAGTYTVVLVVTDDVGRKSTPSSQPVAVGIGGPTASFQFSPSAPVVAQPVAFDASASRPTSGRSITSYAWQFDDGTTGSGVQPSHAYIAAGTYNVILTITDSAGQTAVVTRPVIVTTGNPTASFTISPTAPHVGQDVFFDARSSTAAAGRTIVTYSWNFGDGTGDLTGPNAVPNHRFQSAGTFIVRLTVTDDLGKTNTITTQLTIAP